MCLSHKTVELTEADKERIAHAKVCKNWSISENTCEGHICQCGRLYLGAYVCGKCEK